jgi:glycosyltransferase involved in cell wall biosynthesis
MDLKTTKYIKNPTAFLEDDYPYVSVIVPCRNEETCIALCLDSLLANDYPMDRLEIVVVDGMSVDGTKELVNGYISRYPNISLIQNEKKTIPAAMNLGISHSTGHVVMKADAHSSYPPHYVRETVKYLIECRTDMVGGVLTIAPRNETLMAKSIALALSDRFGSGNASVKVGAADLRWADAVAFGCWKREIFNEVGLFDERLVRNSDMEHNLRIRAKGGRILLVPQIKVTYYADADLWSFGKHNFADGLWSTYAWKFRKQAASWRHFVPLALVLTFLALLAGVVTESPLTWIAATISAAYVVINLAISVRMSIRLKHPLCTVTLPIVFAIRHIAHGAGALYGLLLLVLPTFGRRNVQHCSG